MAILSLLRTVDAGVIAEPEIVRDGAMLIVSWSEQGVRARIDDRQQPLRCRGEQALFAGT